MSMDWSDVPAEREFQMKRAAEALRKKPKAKPEPESPCRKRNMQIEKEKLDYWALMRKPYAELLEYKRTHPKEWAKIEKGHALPQYESTWG